MVVADSHHFDEEHDPDRDAHECEILIRIRFKSETWIRNRIKVMRIRKPLVV
jgi:hypothetical protein